MLNTVPVVKAISNVIPKVLLQAKKEVTAQAEKKKGSRSKMWNNGPWDNGHWANRK